MHKIHNYIHGNHTSFSSKELIIYDPSTGEECSKVVLSNSDDFESALNSSKKNCFDWANTTPLKRSRILSRYKNSFRNIQNLITHDARLTFYFLYISKDHFSNSLQFNNCFDSFIKS